MNTSQPDEAGPSRLVDGSSNGQSIGTSPWRNWSDDSQLRSTLTSGAHGKQPSGEDLDLHLGWDRFEKLMLAISQDVLGLRGVKFRRYGVRGQSQQGIDLAGREPDGRYTVVQCKEYRVFTAADLRKAVGTFTRGRQPFQAYRLIVATSASTEATGVATELARLQNANPGLELDLWGSEQINERLHYRGDIVARFWTRETAAVFCTGAPLPGVPAPRPDRQTLAERTLVGPLATDDVIPILREAETKLSEVPEDACRLYGELAARLDEAGFRGHGTALRHKQLDALQKAGLWDDSADLAARLAAVALMHGDRLEPRKLAQLLNRTAASAQSKGTVRSAVSRQHALLIDAAVTAVMHPLGSSEPLLNALGDTADDGLEYWPLLVLLLAEELIATRPDRLGALNDLLGAAIGQASENRVEGGGEDVVIRLRLARAEHDPSEREELLRLARGHRLPARHKALISAREARHCCLQSRAEEAVESWRDAVHEAIHAELPEDAADWLYAIRAAHVSFGPLTLDIDEEHHLAQALRTTGAGQLLSRIRPPRAQAMAALARKKPIEAVLSARRWLTDAVTTGSWAEEREALDFLADLYRSNNEPELAAALYERAGNAKKLTELASHVGDHLLPMGSFDDAPWWVLYARATIVAEQEDLLEDVSASTFLDSLTDLASRGRAGELTDSPTAALSLRATKAACALSTRGTATQAAALLALLADDVPREPGHYRHTDVDHASAAAAIAVAHPELAAPALTRLFDLADQRVDAALNLLVNDQVLGLLVPPGGGTSVGDEEGRRSVLDEAECAGYRRRLSDLADEGSHVAAAALAELEPNHPSLRERAEKARIRILHRPAPAPGRVDIGTTLVSDSCLVGGLGPEDLTACVAKLLSLAADPREAASTRGDALTAVRNIVLVHRQGVAPDVFSAAQMYVLGAYEVSAFDALTGRSHPLSAFKINTGSSSLRTYGLRLAVVTATSAEHRDWVKDQAVGMLRSDDPTEVTAAALALNELPTETVCEIDADLLAAHDHVSVRRLSAVLCMRAPDRYRGAALRLARDSDFRVRHTLAEAAAGSAAATDVTNEILRLLGKDARHSVRTAGASRDRLPH
ncbi:restriction endonuclease [Streptomyces rubiginosohelvolus]|uniref:restriction endonuclease n=1 Tax=Streptomyces rubiginosohelvolus TaxID=67362 RepID=UPI0033A2812F